MVVRDSQFGLLIFLKVPVYYDLCVGVAITHLTYHVKTIIARDCEILV